MKRAWAWGLLLAFVAILGLGRLRFDAEILGLLPPQLPAVSALQWQQKYFSGTRELLVTLQGENPERLATLAREITQALRLQSNLVSSAWWQSPAYERPGDLAEFLAWAWRNQPPGAVADLDSRLQSGNLEAAFALAREQLATGLSPEDLGRFSYDPLGLTRLPSFGGGDGFTGDAGRLFASEDERFRIIRVTPVESTGSYRSVARWLDAIRREVTAVVSRVVPDGSSESEIVTVAYTGGPAFLAEIASGMERDLAGSTVSTLLLIASLFWLAHRAWRPMLWLAAALLLILAGTLAIGGLILGTLNVVSIGFAAILLGLCVDYGLVVYQESLEHRSRPILDLRRELRSGIGWSAATTALAFLTLTGAGLPGLSQLGVLTAIGVVLGAVVMLFVFLPRARSTGVSIADGDSRRRVAAGATSGRGVDRSRGDGADRWMLVATVFLVVFSGGTLGWRGWPVLTASSEPLRPRNSPAYLAMDALRPALGLTNEPLMLLINGTNAQTVAETMLELGPLLEARKGRGELAQYRLPGGVWPNPRYQGQNRSALELLGRRRDEVLRAGTGAGFTSNSLALTDGILGAWTEWGSGGVPDPVWPDNPFVRWLTSQFAARTGTNWLALGFVEPGSRFRSADLAAELHVRGAGLTGWSLLGDELLQHTRGRVVGLTAFLIVACLGCLRFAFGRWREVVLGAAALGLALILLQVGMVLFGAQWNLINLVAWPLLLGCGVDYSIHVQLTLRRHGGDGRCLWRSTARALVLCALTTMVGFGSLAWSGNSGLASLGAVCSAGTASVAVVALGFLPSWWRWWDRRYPDAKLEGPSKLYQFHLWSLALRVVQTLPRSVAMTMACGAGWIYGALAPRRLKTVAANLLPWVGDDPKAARRAAHQNLRQFCVKLVDLWRYEAGCREVTPVIAGTGWEHLQAGVGSGQGVLLVTLHLGNWEFGAPFVATGGRKILVLSASEPGGARFTEKRAAARARAGVDTLVVGSDPFAFIAVIQRLQSDGLVALLLDRPDPRHAVDVLLAGRILRASPAAAELARAAGCQVVPVAILREGNFYKAHALAPVPYDRALLGSCEGRAEFTGRIVRAFEPWLRQHPDQWFHFVPIWASRTAAVSE